MFPLRDHNPSGRTPYVVYALMAANILIFLMSLDFRGDERELWNHYVTWAVFPVRITEGDGYYTLITSTFLHGGFMHLAGNMLFLWIFGDNMEDQMGHGGFLVFYAICGVAASLFQVMSNPDSAIPLVGASGAIAGVMGGYLLLFPKARIDILLILIIFFRIFTIPAWILLGVWMGMQVFGGLGADPETGGVAYWAHGGGFVVGLVLTVPLWLRLGGAEFWRRTEGHPDHAPIQRSVPTWSGGPGPWGKSARRDATSWLTPPTAPQHPDDLHWTPERQSTETPPAPRKSSLPTLDQTLAGAGPSVPSVSRHPDMSPAPAPRTASPAPLKRMPSKPGSARAMAHANALRAASKAKGHSAAHKKPTPQRNVGSDSVKTQMPGSQPLDDRAEQATPGGQMPRITNRRGVKPVTRPGSPWQTRRK